MRINGQEVAVEALPEGLDLTGLLVDYEYSALGAVGVEVTPVVTLNDRLYVIKGGRLEAYESSGLNIDIGIHQVPSNMYDDGTVGYKIIQDFGLPLRDYTRDLEQIWTEVQHHEQAARAIQAAQARVLDAARMVQRIPMMQVESYLDGVQLYNSDLYGLLMREWSMEREAKRLAAALRYLEEGDERAEKIAAFLQKLDEIFELKQENRRQEIEQLEAELDALKNRLKQREAVRDRLIEERLRELIGDSK